MLKVIVIMGEPGTGKTTLLKKLVDLGAMRHDTSVSLVPHYCDGEGLYVLGTYNDTDGYAQGTDRMSMACQPNVIKWLAHLHSTVEEPVVILEGDRLANQSFLEHCNDNYILSVFYLSVSEEERQRRYAARGSEQSAQFLRGRETKYSRLLGNFVLRDSTTILPNETEGDQKRLVTSIMNAMLEDR